MSPDSLTVVISVSATATTAFGSAASYVNPDGRQVDTSDRVDPRKYSAEPRRRSCSLSRRQTREVACSGQARRKTPPLSLSFLYQPSRRQLKQPHKPRMLVVSDARPRLPLSPAPLVTTRPRSAALSATSRRTTGPGRVARIATAQRVVDGHRAVPCLASPGQASSGVTVHTASSPSHAVDVHKAPRGGHQLPISSRAGFSHGSSAGTGSGKVWPLELGD